MTTQAAHPSKPSKADSELLANRLTEFIPQALIAEMLMCSPSSVSRWVRGEAVSGEATCERLSVLLDICETVHDPTTPWVARAWFVAMNPNFSYDTPKNRFMAGELASVVEAANDFRATTTRLNREERKNRTNG